MLLRTACQGGGRASRVVPAAWAQQRLRPPPPRSPLLLRTPLLFRPQSTSPLSPPPASAGARWRVGRAAAVSFSASARQSAVQDWIAQPDPSQRQQQDQQDQQQQDQQKAQQRNGAGLGARMVEAAATTFASIFVLGAGFALAGYAYHRSYKHLVLRKMEHAFEPGDPVLELAALGRGRPRPPAAAEEQDHWVARDEQQRIDDIVAGRDAGHYHLLVGEKGTGKSSMLIEAMRKIDGAGVAMFEAHPDLEIVRIRLGRALDFEFHEDYIGAYFSERGPRDTTALLDIERALNKLEKVALRHRHRRRRPLVLIVNQTHLLRDDDDGRDLLALLQQRAEQWAGSGLVTMVFSSDDYWVWDRFRQLATRMEVHPVTDLPRAAALEALRLYRRRYFAGRADEAKLEEVYRRVGGRIAFLNRVAKADDMLDTCDRIQETERRWLLSNCWVLGEEMDDDVMDQQKWASAALVLALALVDREKEMETTYDPETGHLLPSFPFHEAQQVQTRCDFIRRLDSLNLFAITSDSEVRASSVPMYRAFRDVCAQPGFRDHLQATLDRISAIESLGRTREIVAKDLVQGGRYRIRQRWSPGSVDVEKV